MIKELGELDHPEHMYYHGVTMIHPETNSKLFEGKTIDDVFEQVKKNYEPQGEFFF